MFLVWRRIKLYNRAWGWGEQRSEQQGSDEVSEHRKTAARGAGGLHIKPYGIDNPKAYFRMPVYI